MSDVHFAVECSVEPHLAQLCRTMMKMLMTCVGAAAVEHASSNAVEPNEASRRRAARLRLFRARTPRAVSLDGVRVVSWPSRATADVVEATEFFQRREGPLSGRTCGRLRG